MASFSRVEQLSGSEDERSYTPSLSAGVFNPIAGLSGSDSNDPADSDSDGSAPAGPPVSGGRQSKKRKRQEISDAFRRRLSSPTDLQNLLHKACRGCKHRCLEKMKPDSKFQELVQFRKEWVALHKLDQDRLIFDRMAQILREPRDAGALPQWRFLNVIVCLKAWKRLHGIGFLQICCKHFNCWFRFFVQRFLLPLFEVAPLNSICWGLPPAKFYRNKKILQDPICNRV